MYRAPRTTFNKESCNWWKNYINVSEDDSIYTVTSKKAKYFRKRFRVPYAFFESILLPWVYTVWGTENPRDCVGKEGIPIEIKVLGALRVLGRSSHFDDIADMVGSGDGGEAFRTFFHDFCAKVKDKLYKQYVKWPETEEEIREAREPYTLAGLTGCIASTDGVHIRWDTCPYNQTHDYKGKEGYPTISFSVTGSHRLNEISIQNDMTMHHSNHIIFQLLVANFITAPKHSLVPQMTRQRRSMMNF